jgi:hypothetical protein
MGRWVSLKAGLDTEAKVIVGSFAVVVVMVVICNR